MHASARLIIAKSWKACRIRCRAMGCPVPLRTNIITSFVALVFAAGLSQAVARSQSPLPPTEPSLSRSPALVSEWANRLRADDPKVRAAAEAALVQGALR